jgi:RES domain-containing protein
MTRAIGDEWLSSQSSLLLRVPSAVAPNSFNCLFNPRHADAALAKVLSATKHPFDTRLM